MDPPPLLPVFPSKTVAAADLYCIRNEFDIQADLRANTESIAQKASKR
jgi:hypothetical protein